MAKKDPYDILGVSKSASEQEIKQAYRKLSRELHPDKHKGDKDKEAKFKEVNAAYEVLSDPKKKQMYDQFGSADGQQFGGGAGGFGGFDFSGFQGGNFDASQFEGFSDIFESFFGGGGRRAQRDDGRGRDVQIEITVPFADAVSGATREISFETLVPCDACKGSGGAEGSKQVDCDECRGSGSVTRTTRSLFGTIQQRAICPRCRGAGKLPSKPCKTCGGQGRIRKQKTVSVNIPAGIDDGQALKLAGQGEAGINGAQAGSLLVRIRVEPDRRFMRDGDDIRSLLTLDVVDAVLGATIDVDTVHGPVSLVIPAGTQPDHVLRIKGKGMPVLNTTRHGDHYVTVALKVPTKLSREEREGYEKLRKTK